MCEVWQSLALELFHHRAQTQTERVRSAIGSIKFKAPIDGNVFLQYYESIKDKEHSDGTFVDSAPGGTSYIRQSIRSTSWYSSIKLPGTLCRPSCKED
jgi:hypothetical protein